MVVASTNDPYAALRMAEGLAAAWGSDIRVAGELGHLTAASGLGAWPQGRRLLAELVGTTPGACSSGS